MANWLQRMFTLPKSKNSLSDILGEQMAAVLKQLGRRVVREAVDGVLLQTDAKAGHLRPLVIDAVVRALGGVPAGVRDLLRMAVESAIPPNITVISERDRDKLLNAIFEALKI